MRIIWVLIVLYILLAFIGCLDRSNSLDNSLKTTPPAKPTSSLGTSPAPRIIIKSKA
jgi:hypothetical protein